MGLTALCTQILSSFSVVGSLLIILSYAKFPALQDFTFLIVAHMAVANALMNFSMIFLHGSIVIPLCSTSTLIFYSSATSYVYFVSIVSYLLYRKIVLRAYLVKDELRRRLVIAGWILPLLWLAIPSAIPSFWSLDGKLVDGCKQLSEVAENMNISHGHDESGLYVRAVLRIGLFLFVPSCCSVLFNCVTIYRTRKALKEGKRLAATQKWLANTPIVSIESSSNIKHVHEDSRTFTSRSRRKNGKKESSGYYHTTNRTSKPDDFLEFEIIHESNKDINSFGTNLTPQYNPDERTHVIDYEHRSALDMTLMDRFSKFPIVFVLCWLMGTIIYFLYMVTGSTHMLELAIFHFANAGMGELLRFDDIS